MRIRIGKDISAKWAVLTDGSALPLNKEELTLELAGPNGKSQSMEFEVEGNVLTTTFYGKDQNYTGDYMLTLWKNKGKEGQSVVDKTSAFSLVRYTPQEDHTQKYDNLNATLTDLGDTSLVTIYGPKPVALVCNLTGYKAVEDVSDLPMEPSTIGYLVGDNLYVYVGEGGDVRLGAYKNCGPFRGLKGDTGTQGPQGNSGYQGAAGELQVVNNLTDGGEAAALSAEQGKVLDEKKQDNLQTYHESGDYTETSIGVQNVILAQASCSDNTRSSLLLVDKDETDDPEQRVARLAVEKDGKGAFSSHVGAYGDKVQIGAPNVIINATGGRKAATFEATVNADDNTSCVALSLSHTPDGQTDPVIDSKVEISDEAISMETVYTDPDYLNSARITMDSTTNELDVYAGNEKNNSCIDIDGGTMVLNATDSLQIGAGPSGGDNTGVHIEKGIVRVQTADGVTEIVANDEEGILLSGKKISMTSGEKTVKDVVRTILGHTDDIQKLQDDTEDLQSKKQDKFATIKEIGGVTTIQTYHIDTNGNGHDELIEVGSEDNCVHIKSYSEDSDSTSSIKVSANTGVTVISPNGEIEDIVKAIQDNTHAVNTLNGTGEGSVSKTVTDKIAEVVANAPADFDTLKEIADYIASDKTNAAQIETAISNLQKVEATLTKSVTKNTEDITKNAEELAKQAEELENKAPKSGYAPELKVNFAKELVGRGEATLEVIGSIRPTGEISIGDGNATIERIKGESVVWNQIIRLTKSYPQYDAELYSITLLGGTIAVTRSEGGTTDRDSIYANFTHNFIALRKYLLIYNLKRSDGQNTNHNFMGGGIYDGTSYHDLIGTNGQDYVFFSPTESFTSRLMQISQIVTKGVALSYTLEPVIYDLTQMFGAGNEPTTIEEFEAREPLGVSNEYNEGTIIAYNGDALKSVGFNAYNGTYAKVIGGETYHATGTTSISFAKELDGDRTPITLDSDNKFIPEEDGYVYAEGTNIVIHLTHSYTPDHVDEYEEDVHPLPNVTSIFDADGNQLFPYGLLSAGSVHDEITATKAIKRVGVVDIGTLDWGHFKHGFTTYSIIPASGSGKGKNLICAKYPTYTPEEIYNNDAIVGIAGPQSGYWGGLFLTDSKYSTGAELKAAMSGILLYYELAEPIEVDLPEPLNMTYEAWDFGTEELVAEGATTPLNADIIYQFNAVDRIRENTTKNKDLEARIAALEAMITQLTTQTTNEEEIEDEQM